MRSIRRSRPRSTAAPPCRPRPRPRPTLAFPAVEETTLSNGVKVVLANRPTVPVVNIAMQFDAGYASDAVGAKLGTASFAGSMLDEGTQRRTALKIAEELEGLGATLAVNSNLDMTGVTLSALKSNSPRRSTSWPTFRNPSFDQAEMDKLRQRWIAGICGWMEKEACYGYIAPGLL